MNTKKEQLDEDTNFVGVDLESKQTPSNSQKKSNSNINNLLLSCVKNEEYCFTLLDFFKKMFHYSQLDLFSAYTQLIYCFKPKEIYNIYSLIQLFFFQAFFCLITIGFILAFVLKYLVEKYLKNEELGFNRGQSVEYLYAFDIHCNGFVVFYTFSVVSYFIFMPFLSMDALISTFLSNFLLFFGVIYYFYVTLMGYYCKYIINLALPYVKKNKLITLGIWPLVMVFFLLTLFDINLMKIIIITLLFK